MAATNSTISAAGSRESQNPGSSATALEYICLFTHDLRRKQKRWQDGRLKFHTFNKRLMVHDDRGNYIGDSHWRSDWEFGEGEELQLERGGVLVQVNECVGSQTQDLSELLDKRVQEKEQRQANVAARSNTATPARVPVPLHRPQTPADNFRLRHVALNRVLGTPPTHLGRAHVPTESPFEQRNKEGDGQSNERPQKRRKRDDSPPSKAGYAKTLFGATLSLSGGFPSSAPAQRQPIPQYPTLRTSSHEKRSTEPASSPPEDPKTSRQGNMGLGSSTRPQQVLYQSNQANGGLARGKIQMATKRDGHQETAAHSDVVDLCSSGESAKDRPVSAQVSKKTANQPPRRDHAEDGQSSRPTAKGATPGLTSRRNAVRKLSQKRKPRQPAGSEYEHACGNAEDAEDSAPRFPDAARKPLSDGTSVANRISRELPNKSDRQMSRVQDARAGLRGDEERRNRQPLPPPPKESTVDSGLETNDQAGLGKEKKAKLRLQSRKRKGILVVSGAETKKSVIADDGDDRSEPGSRTAEEQVRSRPGILGTTVQDDNPPVSTHPPEVLKLPDPMQHDNPLVSSPPPAAVQEVQADAGEVKIDAAEVQVDTAEKDILDKPGVKATSFEQPSWQHEPLNDNTFASSPPRAVPQTLNTCSRTRSKPTAHGNVDAGEETSTATKCKKAILPWKRASKKERRAEDVYDLPVTSADESQMVTSPGNENSDDGDLIVRGRKTRPKKLPAANKKSEGTKGSATEDSDSEPIQVNGRTGKALQRRNRTILEESQSSEADDVSEPRSHKRLVKKRSSRTDRPEKHGPFEDSEGSEDHALSQPKGAKTKRRCVRPRARDDSDDEALVQPAKPRSKEDPDRKRRRPRGDSECSEAESVQELRFSSRLRKRPAKEKRHPKAGDDEHGVPQPRVSRIKSGVKSKNIVGFVVDPDLLEKFNRSTFRRVVSYEDPMFVSQDSVVSQEAVVSPEAVVSQEAADSQEDVVSPEPVMSHESMVSQEPLVPQESVDDHVTESVIEIDETTDTVQLPATQCSPYSTHGESTDVEATQRVNNASPPVDLSSTRSKGAHAEMGMKMTAASPGTVEQRPSTLPQSGTEMPQTSVTWSGPGQRQMPGVSGVAVSRRSGPASPDRQHASQDTLDTDPHYQPITGETGPPQNARPVGGQEGAHLGRPSAAAGSFAARALCLNNTVCPVTGPIAPVTSTDGTRGPCPPRIVNPATRGRKAALKTDAAGKAPQPFLPMEPFQAPARVLVPKPAVEEDPTSVERPKRGMRFPGFAPVSAGGPWSREAHDLLGMERPE